VVAIVSLNKNQRVEPIQSRTPMAGCAIPVLALAWLSKGITDGKKKKRRILFAFHRHEVV
jgi:hypothetical protein